MFRSKMTKEDKLDINYSLVADIASGTANSVRIRKFAEYITDLETRLELLEAKLQLRETVELETLDKIERMLGKS